MIRVSFEQRHEEFLLNVSGHEGNQDDTLSLLCNSVSVLTQTFIDSALQFLDKDKVYIQGEKGRTLFRIAYRLEKEDKLHLEHILGFYLTGIKRLQSVYCEKLLVEFAHVAGE